MTFFLVEEDAYLSQGLSELLQKNGYVPFPAAALSQARAAIQSRSFDLLILDVTLSDGDGVSFCRELRGQGRVAPILFLTARDEEFDIVRGLDAGGNDYVTKPFRIQELLSRIRVLLRKDFGTLARGSLQIDPQRMQVSRAGEILPLTLTEYRILLCLIRQRGIATRDILLNALWDNDGKFVDDNTLSVDMCIIVQTQTHIFRNDWKPEFDGLEPLTIRLPFLINPNFGKQRFHELPLFLIVHDGIELIKVNQHLVDVVACQLFRLNCHLLGSGGNELVFCILDLIIHLVKPVIKVCFAFDVVFVVRVEGINFIHQPSLYGIALAKLLFMRRNLLLNGRGIHLHTDLFLHHSGELRIAYQLYNNLRNGAVQQLFIDLLLEVAFMSVRHCTMLAAIVIKILVF